jgi:hypothetical protein
LAKISLINKVLFDDTALSAERCGQATAEGQMYRFGHPWRAEVAG